MKPTITTTLDEHPPDRLRRFLTEHAVDADLVVTGVPMPSVALAARAIGVAEEQIVKSVLFRGRDGSLTLIIASGTARIDPRLLAAVSGLDRPRLADPATVLAATGYAVGGVPPVGHRTRIPVVMDASVAALPLVYGGGGSAEMLLRIRPAEILRCTGAVVAEVGEGSRSGEERAPAGERRDQEASTA